MTNDLASDEFAPLEVLSGPLESVSSCFSCREPSEACGSDLVGNKRVPDGHLADLAA